MVSLGCALKFTTNQGNLTCGEDQLPRQRPQLAFNIGLIKALLQKLELGEAD